MLSPSGGERKKSHFRVVQCTIFYTLMSRKRHLNLTAPERLMAVVVTALAVVAVLVFAISQKDEIISKLSPDKKVNVPLVFETAKNFSGRVVKVDSGSKIISVDSDIEDTMQAGTYVTKRLSIQISDNTELEKLNIYTLHVNASPENLSLGELEPGTAIVVSSMDNPQAVSTINALAVRQYVR